MRHLITSALPYINGTKHLGNLVGSMLPADVFARFKRQQGGEVLFICATDEHGTPTEIAALKAGQDFETFCAERYESEKKLYADFRLSFDFFGRTSRPQNHELTQHLFKKLDENGWIEEKSMQMIYSEADKRFLPDRYVEGTCPFCAYEKARGDQCENCGKELEPTELKNPRSAISGSTNLEVRETKHLYLRLSKMVDKIRAWVDSRTGWPHLSKSIAHKWLDEGLQDRGITRDLTWGVPVPKAGYENKVFYVWFDAPIGYIAATKEWGDAQQGRDWKSWWYNTNDVVYTQFMGKDNINFHSINFPATLIGSGEPWKTVDFIKGFNWLNYAGGKFSTSSNRGVFMYQAIEILPADYWRYYLISRAPESSDSDFTWADFQATVNKDLADVLGNLVNRTLQFCAKKFGPQVPAAGTWTKEDDAFVASLQSAISSYAANLDGKEFRKAAQDLRAIWVLGNEYLATTAPWTVAKENPERAGHILNLVINFLRLVASLSAPVIPDTADKIAAILGTGNPHQFWPQADNLQVELKALPAGHAFTVPEVLFQKLDDDTTAALEARFSGAAKAA